MIPNPPKTPCGGFPAAEGEPALGRRFVRTGEFRSPRAGDWYLSGAIPEAYLALARLDSPVWILRPILNLQPHKHWLNVYASTELRARTIFGVGPEFPLLRRNLPLSPEQRAEFGENAQCWAADAVALAEAWLNHR